MQNTAGISFGSISNARAVIGVLVDRYRENRDRYRSPSYNEETTRNEFLNPFFESLGWDLANRAGAAEQYKDVLHEESIRLGEFTKAPDYTFRFGGVRKFFLEAKKPLVDIGSDPDPAFQLRRYAWSAKLPLSILTDFEEFAVYDTRVRPSPGDKPSTARIMYIRFDEYLPRLGEIWGIFSKEAVLRGSFDRYIDDARRKRGTTEVDSAFLAEIEIWRETLARNIAIRNPRLDTDDLNFAVQAIINRIIFLRIAEGRGAETYGGLLALVNGANVYERLMALCRAADGKYNSGLFDFRRDGITPALALDDGVVKMILSSLYYPASPYEFSVIPTEILGNVYEQFLGKVIRLTAGHRAVVESKAEVKKAGGVYYTPTYISAYVVRHTIGRLSAGGSPKRLSTLRILDPACGSGSFLLSAYQYLLDAYLTWYSSHSPGRRRKEVYLGAGGWRLTTAEKHRILLNSVFGVDIDPQAVEVTKLSLLLKVLEGESDETLRQASLYGERALPSLEKNIKCGNSLVDSAGLRGTLFDHAVEERGFNPFDWNREFSGVMKNGGFDAVIGNPPYVRIQVMKEWAPAEVELYKGLYESAARGSYDLYVVFIERGLSLLRHGGRLGFIVPNKFVNSKYGTAIRRILAQGEHVAEIVNFGDQQVFEGSTTYTCLLFLTKETSPSVEISNVRSLSAWRSSGAAESGQVSADSLKKDEWSLAVGEGAGLWRKLETLTTLGEVADIFVGLQTSADDIFILQVVKEGERTIRLFSRSLEREWTFEKDLLHPVLSGVDIKSYEPLPKRQYILFPYVVDRETAILLTFRQIQEKFPRTAEYLVMNKKRLEQREKGKFHGDTWYRLGRNQNLGIQGRRKVCVARLVRELGGAYDSDGSFFLDNVDVGGVTWKAGRENYDLYYLVALLNSSLLRWYFPFVSAPFRGGFLSANRQFLSRLPIRTLQRDTREERGKVEAIGTIAAEILRARKQVSDLGSPYRRAEIERKVVAMRADVDQRVYEHYGLTDKDIQMVEKARESQQLARVNRSGVGSR